MESKCQHRYRPHPHKTSVALAFQQGQKVKCIYCGKIRTFDKGIWHG